MLYFRLILLLVLCTEIASCENSTNNNVDSTIEQDSLKSTSTVIMPSAVEFPSLDGLLISGVLWEIDKNSPTILLCHQAGSNFHEYDEIAPKLNQLGYNCLAIDQRAGGILFDIVNQTADRAISDYLNVGYIDAQQDIEAAINFTINLYDRPIILWGSSYSAGLALHLAETNKNVRAVIAFSPGDYFEDEKPLLMETMKTFTKPFFITSAKFEAKTISSFLLNSPVDSVHVHFIPLQDGKHGSKALWNETSNNEEYWNSLTLFLQRLDK